MPLKKYFEIDEFEKKTDYKLSESLKSCLDDFRDFEGEFLSNINPFTNWKRVKEYDWFLNKNFTPEEEEILKDVYVIGDIMIDSHQWGIIFNSTGEVEKIIELDFYKIVAKSFEDFLEKVKIAPYSLVG